MEILSTSLEIANYLGINEKKSRELLISGIIPCITTGTEKKKRYYTTDIFIDFAFERIQAHTGKEYPSMREAFLEREIDASIHYRVNEGHKAQVITVANLKGGVGKTTDTVNIAVSLSKLGQKVLIVDMDAQAQSSRYFRKVSYTGRSILSLFETYHENKKVTKEEVQEKIVTFNDLGEGDYSVDILPSEIRLTKKLEITRMTLRPERILGEILSSVMDEYDFILCDTPPYPGLSLELSFFASDKVILSTEAEEFSIEGMESTIEELNSINQFTAKSIAVDAIFVNSFTRHNYQSKALDQIIDIHHDKFGGRHGDCGLYIVKSSPTIVGQAQSVQLPIIAWRPRPKEVLNVAEPFFDYAISLINENTKKERN